MGSWWRRQQWGSLTWFHSDTRNTCRHSCFFMGLEECVPQPDLRSYILQHDQCLSHRTVKNHSSVSQEKHTIILHCDKIKSDYLSSCESLRRIFFHHGSAWSSRNSPVFFFFFPCVFLNSIGKRLLIIPQCFCRLICMWLISVWRSCLWSAGRNPDSSVLHNLRDVLEIEFPSPATHEKSVCHTAAPSHHDYLRELCVCVCVFTSFLHPCSCPPVCVFEL